MGKLKGGLAAWQAAHKKTKGKGVVVMKGMTVGALDSTAKSMHDKACKM